MGDGWRRECPERWSSLHLQKGEVKVQIGKEFGVHPKGVTRLDFCFGKMEGGRSGSRGEEKEALRKLISNNSMADQNRSPGKLDQQDGGQPHQLRDQSLAGASAGSYVIATPQDKWLLQLVRGWR